MASRAKDATMGSHLHLAGAMEANKTELSHMDGLFAKYTTAVDELQAATQLQTALTASKQDASKRVQSTMGEANRIATVIKVSLREHYGSDSEKLVEFGLQPFRGRARKAKPAEEGPEVRKAVSPAGSPTGSDDGKQ